MLEPPMGEVPDPSAFEGDYRTVPRVPAAIQVNVRSRHAFWTGLTRDISEGGVSSRRRSRCPSAR